MWGAVAVRTKSIKRFMFDLRIANFSDSAQRSSLSSRAARQSRMPLSDCERSPVVQWGSGAVVGVV